ncbi:MAG: ADP-ribosylation factor-like protein [Promethearchaeota archaeon]
MSNEIKQDELIKVVIMGLENAGKTTIVDVLAQKIRSDQLNTPDMHPTKNVERRTLSEKNVVVWDFGGQEIYRNEYLADPENYLRSISYAYYVVDVQDYYRVFFSVMFFMTVLPTIIKHSPDAEIGIIFHKTDPKFDPKKKNIKSLFLDKVEPFILGHKKSIEIFDTTIFEINSIKNAFNHFK